MYKVHFLTHIDVSICDSISILLFRFPGASSQEGIHRFLFQVAAHYKEQANAVEFVTDLLRFGTPELFAVCLTKSGEESLEDDAATVAFVQSLQNFIVENELRNQLLSQMKEILVRNIH